MTNTELIEALRSNVRQKEEIIEKLFHDNLLLSKALLNAVNGQPVTEEILDLLRSYLDAAGL